MKLNLGCGKDYKEGYINIDAYDKTLADKKMPVDNLDYPSDSIEEIQAIQLIEHLGFYKTVYALAEWFRVLKPNGTLIIETPNIEKTFKKFLNSNIETKKQLITWIFGLEKKGMTHIFCFPIELLEITLKRTGFTKIKKTFTEKEKNHPTLRIQCVKPLKNDFYQTVAIFRKKIANEKLIDISKYYETTTQEKLIDFIITKTQLYKNKKDKKILDEILLEGGICSPEIVKTFFQECSNNKILNKKKLQFIKKLQIFS